MGIHMAAVVKAKAMVMSMCSQGGQSPVVGGLVFPFVMKMAFSLTLVRKTYCDLLYASRLFFFQLSHIALNNDAHNHNFNNNNNNNNTRFERALRLVYERLTNLRRSQTTLPSVLDDDQNSTALQTLSMLAL